MIPQADASIPDGSAHALEGYYRLHARIYDTTRWTFLFGRRRLVRLIAEGRPGRVLEVGCGTGRNLVFLAKALPKARITGLDLSQSMLRRARRATRVFGDRVSLHQTCYDSPISPEEPFDAVVFSYCLTMINPGWQQAIRAAARDLAPGGRIAVVDFHDTPSSWFRRWMHVNHVRMDGHLRPVLQQMFTPQIDRMDRAYLGLWSYLTFVGNATH